MGMSEGGRRRKFKKLSVPHRKWENRLFSPTPITITICFSPVTITSQSQQKDKREKQNNRKWEFEQETIRAQHVGVGAKYNGLLRLFSLLCK